MTSLAVASQKVTEVLSWILILGTGSSFLIESSSRPFTYFQMSSGTGRSVAPPRFICAAATQKNKLHFNYITSPDTINLMAQIQFSSFSPLASDTQQNLVQGTLLPLTDAPSSPCWDLQPRHRSSAPHCSHTGLLAAPLHACSAGFSSAFCRSHHQSSPRLILSLQSDPFHSGGCAMCEWGLRRPKPQK